MKHVRQLGSLFFAVGIFIAVFVGIPWYVIASKDPVIPMLIRVAIFSLLGGMLLVLLTLAVEKLRDTMSDASPSSTEPDGTVVLLNSDNVPGRETSEILGLVQGHTVFAIWLGNDLSSLLRLILGGELTEYTEMMGTARDTATTRMIAKASELGADAIINVRYMTTSVVGTASEMFAYGTAVKLRDQTA